MPTPANRRNLRTADRSVSTDNLHDEELIRRYIEYKTRVARRRWRPRTVDLRTRQLWWCAGAIAPVTLHEATEDYLLRLDADVPGGLSHQGGQASAVRGLYEWMSVYTRPRLRTDNPAAVIEPPAVPVGAPRPTPDDAHGLALACALADPELYVWLLLMGCHGLRCCEIAWMQVSDVEDRGRGALGLPRFVGKGGERRCVPVAVELMTVLRPFLFGRGPLFTRPSDGLGYTPHAVSQRTNDFLRGIGIPRIAHQLRHRSGTDHHVRDRDVYRQAAIMGHASVDTTRLYTDVEPEEAAEFIARMTRTRIVRTPRRPAVRSIA